MDNSAKNIRHNVYLGQYSIRKEGMEEREREREREREKGKADEAKATPNQLLVCHYPHR